MSARTSVLNILEKSKGKAQSGAAIAHCLGISRNAVWKAINQLKEDGFQIESSRAGYCYRGEDRVLSGELISRALSMPETDIRVCRETASTNDLAKQEAGKGAKHGTVFLADRQTDGKGRLGRSFFSPAGCNVYLSILLKKDFPPNGTMVTLAAAIAVCETIERLTGLKPGVKWVNDIFLEGKKACGILTEASLNFETGSFEYMVVGIGLNLNVRQEDFPPELTETATSVSAACGHSVSRSDFAAEVIRSFFAWYGKTETHDFIEEYRRRCFIPGKEIRVLTAGKEPKRAHALRIDDRGRLVVRYPDGEEQALSSGEISIRLAP